MQNKLSLILLTTLFLITPFYLQPNNGGLGLALPYNISSWVFALIFISLTLAISIFRQAINYHLGFLYCLIFPVIIISLGLFTEVPQADVWLFRQLYIIAGFAFLFALMQSRMSNRQVERLLLIIILTASLHVMVGIVQILDIDSHNWLPPSLNTIPIGIFQQVNVHATFLVTACMALFYLVSRPMLLFTSIYSKIGLVVVFALAVFVIISTGSRVGIISLALATVVMLISRYRYFIKQKYFVAALLIAATIATSLAQSGFNRALDKAEKMTEHEYASARQTMYATALDLIKNKPFLGYGIGSFPRVWADQTAAFLEKNPSAAVSDKTTSHPHNEILLWLIEGGLLAVMGLIVIMVVVCFALYRCGFSRGGAYFALLLPITLHTQVELPFYNSAIHWFVWLFLIYLVFRHQIKHVQINISDAARKFAGGMIILIGLVCCFGLIHAELARKQIYQFMYQKSDDLSLALSDPYFNGFAEKIMMQSLLYNSIKTNNNSKMPLFIDWAERTMQVNPEMGLFIMLNDAYAFIGDTSNQCRVATEGLAIYTKNERLLEAVQSCQN